MNKKEAPAKKPSTGSHSTIKKPAPVAATKSEKQKARDKIKLHRVLVKCTNGKSFYTFSTAGSAKTEVAISCYSDPFVHEVWNKDKVRKISDNNPFQKRFGTMDFGKKAVAKEEVAEVVEEAKEPVVAEQEVAKVKPKAAKKKTDESAS